MMRRKYIKDGTTIKVDRSVAQKLKELRRSKGEPLGEVVRRVLEEYLRMREVVGY
jgi:hypothetical protein